jgi:nitrite reductase/ring-hydroxylating ferredoxin subunit
VTSVALAPVSFIPVGGGVILPEHSVVVTQPEDGVFVAFSSVCPHRQCAVKAVAAGTINCFCHGSRFRITDGSVVGGPAPGPLSRVEIVVTDGVIELG